MTKIRWFSTTGTPVIPDVIEVYGVPATTVDSGGEVRTTLSDLLDSLPESAQAFGATGDGVTDDGAAIQAALDKAAEIGGGTVVLPDGVYVAEGLTVPSNVTLASVGGTLKLKASSLTYLLETETSGENSVIRDITLDGNAANVSASNPLVVLRGNGAKALDINLYDANYDGIVVATGSTRVSISRVRIYEKNETVSTGRHGVQVNGGTYVTVSGCHIRKTTASPIDAGGTDILITGNVCENTGQDLSAYDAANVRITVSDNIIDTSANNGIHVGGTDVVVSGNTVKGVAAQGILVQCSPNSDPEFDVGAVVSGNIVFDTDGVSSGAGISVYRYSQFSVTGNVVRAANTHAIHVIECDEGAVSGNTVTTAASEGIFLIGSREVSVTGNVATDCGRDGIRVAQFVRPDLATTESSNIAILGNTLTSNAGYGIRSVNSTTRLTLVGNHYLSNTTGTYTLVGTDSVVDLATRENIVRQSRSIITETFPLLACTASQISIDGTVYYVLVGLKEGDVVSSLSVYIPTACQGATMTLSKLGLYSTGGTQLAVSAGQGTAWESAGLKTAAMTTPYTAPSNMAAYVAIVAKGTTLPTFLRGPTFAQVSSPIGSGTRPIAAQTAQTDLPSPGTLSAGGIGYYVAVS